MEHQMIRLPELPRRDDGETCKCFPFCKNRRREWKGQILKTSAELLLDKKLPTDYHRKFPHKVHPHPQQVVTICQTPINTYTDTTYLEYVELAKKIGAWKSVCSKRCPFCNCGKCCICNKYKQYIMRDPERGIRRSGDMTQFDRRVREGGSVRNMYD